MNSAKVIVLETPFTLKPYCKGDLVILYSVSLYILNKWLKALEPQMGKIVGRTLSIRQMEIFTHHYGIPGQVVNEAA